MNRQLRRWFLIAAFLIPAGIFLLSLPQLGSDDGNRPSMQRLALMLQTPFTRHSKPAAKEPVSPPQFTPGVPEPHYEYRKALVVSSIQKNNLSWIDNKLSNVDVFRYVNDDPEAELTVPVNKGNEVMAYLTFIIDHYHDLPEIMVFVHAHEVTHHNPWMLHSNMAEMVNALSPQRVIREGFMNMHCGVWDEGDCPAHIRPAESRPFPEFKRAWEELFPEYPVPEVLSQFCCAQFAVSRERVLQIPLETFQRYRQWLLDTDIPTTISGYFWEYLWQWVFAGKHVNCPDMYICYCDGYGYCFGGHKQFMEYNRLWVAMDRTKGEISRMMKLVGEGNELPTPEQERKRRMEAVIDDMIKQLWQMIETARGRGKDPRIRAEESKRPWKKGDGFN